MQSIKVASNHLSMTFSRDGSFLTSVPIRHRVQPGEIVDLVRRLTAAVNSDRLGSLLQKIDDELKRPYVPTEVLTKSHLTRLKNSKNRVKTGRGYLSKEESSRRAIRRRRRSSPEAVIQTATERGKPLPIAA